MEVFTTIEVGKCLLGDIRKSKGLTQAQLARRVDKSKSTISGWETNRNVMELENAANICEILGCEIKDLYEWIHVDEPPKRKPKRGK